MAPLPRSAVGVLTVRAPRQTSPRPHESRKNISRSRTPSPSRRMLPLAPTYAPVPPVMAYSSPDARASGDPRVDGGTLQREPAVAEQNDDAALQHAEPPV